DFAGGDHRRLLRAATAERSTGAPVVEGGAELGGIVDALAIAELAEAVPVLARRLGRELAADLGAAGAGEAIDDRMGVLADLGDQDPAPEARERADPVLDRGAEDVLAQRLVLAEREA